MFSKTEGNSRKVLQPNFIPMTKAEAEKFGWNSLDVIIVSGDAYVDHPSFGSALIGRLLIGSGFKVGIISQADWKNPESLKKLGRPRLCFAISSGNIDSMLKLYTASRRLRKEDDYSESGKPGLCPPMATVVYANLARQAYPGVKVILGGIEASLRRVAHYDYWQDKIRPSILCDSKADLLIYGMGEKAVADAVSRLDRGESISGIRGTARLAGAGESKKINRLNYVVLPDYDKIRETPEELLKSFAILENEMNPFNGRALLQSYGERQLIIEAPQAPLSRTELDSIYGMPFSYCPHPSYRDKIPAYEMIKDSVTAVRGCPGACSFCSLSLHQGKFLQSRSSESLISEISKLAERSSFRGTISDIGGPTANSYSCYQNGGDRCKKCRRVSCLFPEICRDFRIDENEFYKLLDSASKIDGVKHVFIGSGLRIDLALRQPRLMRKIIAEHVSGHLKIAPEHLNDKVLNLMRKNKSEDFFKFMKLFQDETRKTGKKQYLLPYFISNFPGSGEEEFKVVEEFLRNSQWKLQQVQDFIPLPMTIASAIYYCGKNLKGEKVHVNKGLGERRHQRNSLSGRSGHGSWRK
ncbi:MAG TPA: YgiQ family radical SAM protein [Victivallales bacterium]|nr:YgiQ family radical SAM protein [Victivallales bacterium]